MNRISLKCCCGAEAEFEDDRPVNRAEDQARDWLDRHDACPQMLETFRSPVPAAATPGGIVSFPEVPACQHEYAMSTAGHRCRKCGVELNPPSFTTALGGEESPG